MSKWQNFGWSQYELPRNIYLRCETHRLLICQRGGEEDTIVLSNSEARELLRALEEKYGSTHQFTLDYD